MSDNAVPTIGLLDLAVFTAMLALSAIIGCYFGLCSGRQNTATEYLMGGKTMGIIPVSLSLVASFISGITVLGVPSDVYRYGTQYWAVLLSGILVSVTTAFVFVPVYIRLQVTSCYQYLELRFNTKVRRITSILFLINQFTNIPIVIYVPALAFSQVTGVNVHLITPITCLVCIFYTTLGGMRAVVWTDALQSVLMLAAMIAVLLLGVREVGGWNQVWSVSEQGERLEFFNMDPNPFQRHTFWTVLVGSYFQFMSKCAANQGMVQRYLSVPNLRAAKWTLLWFSIGLGALNLLSIITGLVIYTYYLGCDPLNAKLVQRPDQLLPLYVMEIAGYIPGLTGLFVAGVFSAALSSMSTGLNAMSGVIVEDLLANVLPATHTSTWLKIFSAVCGAICVAFVFIVEHLGGVLQATYSLSGITSGTLLGLFVLGMFFPQANSKGALIGSIASITVVSLVVGGTQTSIASGSLRHHPRPLSVHQCAFNATVTSYIDTNDEVWPIFRLSYLYYGLLGVIVLNIVGLIVSFISPEKQDLDRDLFCPPIRYFIPKKCVPVKEEIPLVKK